MIGVPADVGRATLHPRPPERRGGARSYAHDGRCLECSPAMGYAIACDIEALGAPGAAEAARRRGLDVRAFLVLWTRLEVEAKLLSLPIGVLLERARRLTLPSHDLEVSTSHVDDLVISVGWRALASPTRRGRDHR